MPSIYPAKFGGDESQPWAGFCPVGKLFKEILDVA